jgi:hypothetical protein
VRKTHHRPFKALNIERRMRLNMIKEFERDTAASLVRTPYVLLQSFLDVNVVSAAELAGEMWSISIYMNDGGITGRARSYPS